MDVMGFVTYSNVSTVSLWKVAGATLLMRFRSSVSTCSLVSDANVVSSNDVSTLSLRYLQQFEIFSEGEELLCRS